MSFYLIALPISKTDELKIRPKGGENVNRSIGWGIRESIQEN